MDSADCLVVLKYKNLYENKILRDYEILAVGKMWNKSATSTVRFDVRPYNNCISLAIRSIAHRNRSVSGTSLWLWGVIVKRFLYPLPLSLCLSTGGRGVENGQRISPSSR